MSFGNLGKTATGTPNSEGKELATPSSQVPSAGARVGGFWESVRKSDGLIVLGAQAFGTTRIFLIPSANPDVDKCDVNIMLSPDGDPDNATIRLGILKLINPGTGQPFLHGLLLQMDMTVNSTPNRSSERSPVAFGIVRTKKPWAARPRPATSEAATPTDAATNATNVSSNQDPTELPPAEMPF